MIAHILFRYGGKWLGERRFDSLTIAELNPNVEATNILQATDEGVR